MYSLGGLQANVLAQSDLGLHRQNGLQHSAVRSRQGNHLGLRVAHRLQACFLHGSLILVGEQIVDGIHQENVLAVHLLDGLAGSMTLAEALHSVLLALALKSLIGSSAQGLRINGELQFVHALFEFFTFDEFHSISSKQELSLEPSGLRLAHGKSRRGPGRR